MEFLGVGYQEILVVLVLMLVVVGPERLPRMAYQIGRAVRTMQGYARVVRDEFSDEMKYFEEEVATIKGEVESTRATLREADSELKQQQAAFQKDVRATTKSLDAAAQSVNTTIAAGDSRSKVVALPARDKAAANGAGATAADAAPAAQDETAPPSPPLVF